MPSHRYFAIQEEVVDPSRSTDYEHWIKHLIKAMQESLLEAPRWFAGKHNQTYYYAFPLGSLDELGVEGQFQLSFTKATERELSAPLTGVSSSRLSVLERLESYSYRPSNSLVRQPKLAFVDIHQVRDEMQDQYDALVRSLVEAMRKAEYPFAWSAFRTVIGEGRTFYSLSRTYYYTVLFDSMYQFFEQHWFGAALEKALGVAGARQYSATEKKCLQRFENFTCTLRSDLSYQANQRHDE